MCSFSLRSRVVEARKLAMAVFPASVQFRADGRRVDDKTHSFSKKERQDADATGQRRPTGSQAKTRALDGGRRICSCTQHASGKPESHIHLTSNDLLPPSQNTSHPDIQILSHKTCHPTFWTILWAHNH